MTDEMERSKGRSGLVWQLPLLAVAILAAAVFAYRNNDSALATSENLPESRSTGSLNPKNRPLNASFSETFQTDYDPLEWPVSNYTIKNDVYRNSWSSERVEFPEAGGFTMKLGRAREGDAPFVGAEVQKAGWVHFGRFEAIIRSAPGAGAVTSLTALTGHTNQDPHEEINIEWTGNRPEIVQFSIYQDDKNLGTWKQEVPFNAAEELHLYAFDWTPDSITWLIDDEPIFTVTSRNVDIPQFPLRFMTRLWTGEQYQWHGQPTFIDGASADIKCLSFVPRGSVESGCADEFDRLTAPVEDAQSTTPPLDDANSKQQAANDA